MEKVHDVYVICFGIIVTIRNFNNGYVESVEMYRNSIIVRLSVFSNRFHFQKSEYLYNQNIR